MEQATVKLISEIPFPEPSALAHAPVQWALQYGGDTLILKVPLMSFHRFEVWNRLLSGIRMSISVGETENLISLRDILRIGDSDPQILADIESAIVDWRRLLREQGLGQEWPVDFCRVVMAFSDPLDVDYAFTLADKWGVELRLEYSGGCLRELLARIMSHVMPPAKLMPLIGQIRQIQIEVKKKLLADQQVEVEDDGPHWQKVFKRMRARKWGSTESES